MSGSLILSTSLITLALIFYTFGIWSERLARYLKRRHVWMFWIGFAFDMLGTAGMHFLLATGSFSLSSPHTLTGQIALWLMFAHAVWATYVVRKNNVKTRETFHRYSLIVWFVWLVAYIGGMYIGMAHHG